MPITPKIDGIPDELTSMIYEAIRTQYIRDVKILKTELAQMLDQVPTGAICFEREQIGKYITALEAVRASLTDELRIRLDQSEAPVEFSDHKVKFGSEERAGIKAKRSFDEDGFRIEETSFPGLDTTRMKLDSPKTMADFYDRGYVKETTRLTVTRTAPDYGSMMPDTSGGAIVPVQ